MAGGGSGNLLERLGSDLSAAVLLCLKDPADLVRAASVSHSWRRFVIANGFCKMLCLRMTPEISCFVRAIEVGVLPDNLEVGPNLSVQWQMLESEHRTYAYLGYCIVSPRFLTGFTLKPIAISTTAHEEAMLPNYIGPNMFSSYSSRLGNVLLSFKLITKFCVVHEIKIQPRVAMVHNGTLVYKPNTVRFRLGHMRNENANCEESLEGNYIWTYVSPEYTMEYGVVQSIKLLRPVICICAILLIEVFTGVQNSPTDKFFYASTPQIEAIGSPLAPAFDVSVLDGTGNSVLMYFPGVLGNFRRSSHSRNKLINTGKRRRNRR